MLLGFNLADKKTRHLEPVGILACSLAGPVSTLFRASIFITVITP